MFDRYTDRSRRALVLAQDEARLLRHNYMGTEHLLLGLLGAEGLAADALESQGVSIDGVRELVVEIIGRGTQVPEGHLPFTPRLKRVVELSHRETVQQIVQTYVASGHLLLGLLREGDGVGVEILKRLDVDLSQLREQTVDRVLSNQVASLTKNKTASEALVEPRHSPAVPAARQGTRRRATAVASPSATADDLATVAEVDVALAEVLTAKDRAIDAKDWRQVAELRSRERELLAHWATLSRTMARPPGNPGDSGGSPLPLNRPVDLGGRLPDPASSSVILIGTADYDDPELANMPAARHNLLDLADALTAPRIRGFDPARVHTLVNPTREVASRIAEIAEECTDTLVVYYTGHGLVGSNGELHLGLPGTRRRREMYTALSYPELRWAVIESPARSKVVILDCCFSGRAVEWMSAEDGLAEGQIDVTGTYVLTATSATRPAYLPDGARNSAFTGALLDLLRNGSPDGGSLIRLSHVYSSLYRTLTSRGLPAPQQRGTDSIGDLALTRNPSWPG